MGNSKIPNRKPSKISSAAAPSTSASTKNSNRSSILRSLFSPADLPGCFYASVIQGIESQHIRIHDAISGLLQCEHAIKPKTVISSLDWGLYGHDSKDKQHAERRRKRKRSEGGHDESHGQAEGSMALAFTTSDSQVQFLSIRGTVEGSLREDLVENVQDFRFRDLGRERRGWTLAAGGKIAQWNLQDGKCIRSISAPDFSVSSIFPWKDRILCTSQTAYLLDAQSDQEPRSFAASGHTIHSVGLAEDSFLCSSDAERFANVFSIERGLIGTLTAEADITSISVFSHNRPRTSNKQKKSQIKASTGTTRALAVVNKDGIIELFHDPFDFEASNQLDETISRKARLARKSRKASASLKVRRPDTAKAIVALLDVSFHDEFLYFSWAEGGLDVHFDRIRWRDSASDQILLSGSEEIIKAKPDSRRNQATVNGAKQMGKSYVDESRAVIGDAGDVEDTTMADEEEDQVDAISISSGQESSSVFESDSEPEPRSSRTTAVDEDTQMEDPNVGSLTKVDDQRDAASVDSDPDANEPSFGDLLRSREPAVIDVQASFPNQDGMTLSKNAAAGQHTSGLSLGVVISQALRTNDTSLLETCLQTSDPATIRTTINRLDSSLASTLCQRLAERIQSRPGRAGPLVTWIESIVVAHGGYMIGQPALMKSLKALAKVLRERTAALQTFLAINGKLDVIAAQVNFRREALERARAQNVEEEEDDEEAVIYVEGQDEDDDESSSDDEGTSYRRRIRPRKSDDFEAFDEEDNDGDMDVDDVEEEAPPKRITNGNLSDEDESDDDDDGFIDEEAESTDQASDSPSEDDEIDVGDSIDGSDSSGSDDDITEAPPLPRSKTTTNKRPTKQKLTNGIKPSRRR